MDKEIIRIENSNGETFETELVTFLISKDKTKNYVVYTNNELEENKDQIIYVSRIINDNDILKVEEITDDDEWKDVQQLLKEISNK